MLATAGAKGQAAQGALSPLVQSYQDKFNFNQPYGDPLPRPLEAFLNGSFGPLGPIQPSPVDAPREDSGRPEPRRFQYPVGWNLPVGQPGSEGVKLAPFASLRALADMYSVARSCVDRRVGEIVGQGYDIVPTEEAEHNMRGNDAMRADWEKRRKEVKEFFAHPDSDRGKYPTFNSWLSALLEDLFVLDAVSIYIRPPRKKGGGPFGSNVANLDLLDGATIRPLLNMSGSTPSAPSVAYQQYIWGVPRVDLTQVMIGADIAGMEEGLVGEFRSDQLMYLRYRPRVWTPYGFSPVEEALLPINIGLARQQYQWDYYQDGSIPGQFVVPGPDIATPQQIRQLQDALNAMAGDVGAKHRIIVLPPGSKAEAQKPPPMADQFDEWLISQVAMPFGLTPMDLGVTPRVSAVQSVSESKQLSQTNSTQGSAFRVEPLTEWLKQVLFDYLIHKVFGQDDMEWTWGVTDEGEDAESEINLHVTQVQAGLETMDEARIEMGKTPYGLPETSVPLVFTPQGPVPLTAAVQQAEAASAQAQAMSQLAQKDPSALTPGGGKQPAEDKPGANGKDANGKAADEQGKPAQGAPPAAKPPAAPVKKALDAEIQILTRYMRKGRSLQDFRSDVIPAEVLAADYSNVEKGLVAQAVAQAARDWWARQRREYALVEVADWVAKAIGRLVQRWREGDEAYPAAVDKAVDVMGQGYGKAMRAGSEHAADDHALTVLDLTPLIRKRAEEQRGYVTKLLRAGTESDDLAKMRGRFDLYGATLTGAYNSGYGMTVKADDDHEYEIVWRLGETEHCTLCVARADKSFSFEDLPGWPGDGGFGGPLCEGGPNCGCHLDFVEKRQPVSVGQNTQRPDSVAYYAEQNARISQARDLAQYRRERFLETIPGGAAARAAARDTVRQQLAEVVNHAIRALGGYSGVSVEPQDIPAGVLADYLAASEEPEIVKVAQEYALFASVPRHLLTEVCKEWDPLKHPRGPHGRFIATMHLPDAEHHHDAGRPEEHAVQSPPVVHPEHHSAASREFDHALNDAQKTAAHLAAVSEHQASQYTEEALQPIRAALDDVGKWKKEFERSENHKRKEKLAAAIAATLAAVALSVFVSPFLAALAPFIAELVKSAPEMLHDGYEYVRSL